MINLSLNELKLIAQNRNIQYYENKSKNGLVKALSEPKPKPRIKIRINSFLKTFSKKEADKYRKAFL